MMLGMGNLQGRLVGRDTVPRVSSSCVCGACMTGWFAKQQGSDLVCTALAALYAKVLQPHTAILDLASSYESHLPPDMPFASVLGLGELTRLLPCQRWRLLLPHRFVLAPATPRRTQRRGALCQPPPKRSHHAREQARRSKSPLAPAPSSLPTQWQPPARVRLAAAGPQPPPRPRHAAAQLAARRAVRQRPGVPHAPRVGAGRRGARAQARRHRGGGLLAAQLGQQGGGRLAAAHGGTAPAARRQVM